MGSKMIVTKSKIKSLQTCPLLFKWQYIDKRKPDISPKITTIGLDVHDIFERFFKYIKLENIPENPLSYFENCMEVPLQYKGIYKEFCKFQTRLWYLTKNKEEFIPLFCEKNIINDGESGKIDVIYTSNKEYTIIDYKSTCGNPTSLRLELNFYKKLCDDSKIFDKPIKYIGSYGYKTGDFFWEEVGTFSYNTMLKKVDEFKKLIPQFKQIEFPKKVGHQCESWCPYKPSCDKLTTQIKLL